MTLLTVAATSLRELSRRRVALLFVFALPLVFYVVRIDVPWQALRFLALGVGWAIATLALFSHVSARRLDQRLSIVGASPTALFFGRQLAIIGTGCPWPRSTSRWWRLPDAALAAVALLPVTTG